MGFEMGFEILADSSLIREKHATHSSMSGVVYDVGVWTITASSEEMSSRSGSCRTHHAK
jgi:hypothetical protein